MYNVLVTITDEVLECPVLGKQTIYLDSLGNADVITLLEGLVGTITTNCGNDAVVSINNPKTIVSFVKTGSFARSANEVNVIESSYIFNQ